MARNVICWLITSLSLFWMPKVCMANQAAEKISKKIYEDAHHQIVTKQFKQAIWNLTLVSFLEPSFGSAFSKLKKLQEELQRKKESLYFEGVRAYQTLRHDDAKYYWRMASQFALDPQDPLKLKIEKFLSWDKRKLSHRNSSSSRDVSLNETRKTMGDVRRFLESGHSSQAFLSLKEIVYKDPVNERAQDVLMRLQKSHQEQLGSENLSEAIQNQFAKSESFLKEAKEAREKKNFVQAYAKYKEALDLFQKDQLKPPFYKDLENGMKEMQDELREKLKPLLSQWEGELATESHNLKEIGTKLKEIVKKYPPSPQAEGLLQEVYTKLEAKALPILMQANTIQALEGCQSSLGDYARVKEVAVFPEIPVWQEANKNMEVCLASRQP